MSRPVVKGSPGKITRIRAFAGQTSAASAATSSFTEPPAFSIARRADFDAAATSKASFALSSPWPRIFTPSRGLGDHAGGDQRLDRHRRARISLPASTACCMRPRLTSL